MLLQSDKLIVERLVMDVGYLKIHYLFNVML